MNFAHVSACGDVEMGMGTLASGQLPQAQIGVHTVVQESRIVAGRSLLPLMLQTLSHYCHITPACQSIMQWCSNTPEGWAGWQLA